VLKKLLRRYLDMGVFINIHKEIYALEQYDGYGLEMVKGRNKVVLNKDHERYYLDLVSFANAIEVSINQQLEVISYLLSVGEYLAFYRNKQYKPIGVLEITGFEELIKGLRGLGFNLDLLRTIREQCYKLQEQIKKESGKYGEN
jgi:hypothetical protein